MNYEKQFFLQDTVDLQKPPKNELRIIILGAIGSGKSSVGNVLMKNQLGKPFDTSLSAKPNTTKSTLKTMNFLQYKIDIIDTPGTKASGLTDQAMEIEIQKAIALSSPGPHAFVLCISANDIKDNLFDVIKPYENYFGERFYDHVILAFTRNDQNKSNYKNTPAYLHDCKCKIKHEIAQNSSLAKIKNITNNQVCISFPNSTNNDNNTELRKVIKIIEEIKEGSKESKNVEFASCYFSEYAENILYENICKLKKETNGSNISRETVKTSKPYLEHFSRQFCYFCQQFTR